MKTITISDETADFLKSLSHRMLTQDRRGTADPYYITIQKIVEQPVPDECGSDVRYFNHYQSETETIEEIKVYCEQENLDVDEYIDENCTKYSVDDREEYENFFLTYEGYEEHIKQNDHNIAKTCKSFHNYVQYASRNPELEQLYKSIHEIANEI